MTSVWQPVSGRRELLRLSAAATLVSGFVCHGSRWLNAAFSGDATLVSQAGEEAYQISLGRFLQPVWWRVRGTVTAPFLIGLFCLLFLALSGALTARILRLKSRGSVVLACGVLTASETLGLANATYLPWSDVYMLSLFLALSGAYLSLYGEGFRRHLAPLCYAVLLGCIRAISPAPQRSSSSRFFLKRSAAKKRRTSGGGARSPFFIFSPGCSFTRPRCASSSASAASPPPRTTTAWGAYPFSLPRLSPPMPRKPP